MKKLKKLTEIILAAGIAGCKIFDPSEYDENPNANICNRDYTNENAIYIYNAIRFDGTCSSDDNEIVKYEWDFGDGITGTGPKINHRYDVVGNFRVKLVVTDDTGKTGYNTLRVDVLPK